MLSVAGGRWIDAEMKKMRALIKRLFAELNARQDKFDEAILELKASIESLKDQENGGKGVKSAMNALSALQLEIRRGVEKLANASRKRMFPWSKMMRTRKLQRKKKWRYQ
ncbi:hypothetical protein FXO37_14747 [Capsicum annuum]|nr:hypothetical protein FXO37_14747 [Capsicum annuum]